jgi:hypothetical protein
MFSVLVGPVDFNSALVLCVLFTALGVVLTCAIASRRSRRDVDNEFALAKIKESNAQALAVQRDKDAFAMKQRVADQNFQIERDKIGQNLITSHSSSTATKAETTG